MCLLLVNLDGRQIPVEYIIKAAQINRDGFGMMYADKSGSLKTIQGLFTEEQIIKCFEAAEKQNVRYVAHFRMGTRGSNSVENTHPFIVSNEYCGGIGMAHNGTFQIYSPTGGDKSDTRILAERIQDEIMKDESYHVSIFTPTALRLQKDFGHIIGSWNKVAFLNGLGEVNIINEDEGYWVNGVWYSNLYSIGLGYNWKDIQGAYKGKFIHNKEKLAEILGKSVEDLEYDIEELEELDFDAFSSVAEDEETIPECDIETIAENFDDDDKEEHSLWEKWKREYAISSRKKDIKKRIEVDGLELDVTESEIEEFDTTDEIKEQIRKAFLEGIEIDEDDEEDTLASLKKNFEFESKKSTSTALTTTSSSTKPFSQWSGNGYDYHHGGHYYGGRAYGSYQDEKDKFVEMLLKP